MFFLLWNTDVCTMTLQRKGTKSTCINVFKTHFDSLIECVFSVRPSSRDSHAVGRRAVYGSRAGVWLWAERLAGIWLNLRLSHRCHPSRTWGRGTEHLTIQNPAMGLNLFLKTMLVCTVTVECRNDLVLFVALCDFSFLKKTIEYCACSLTESTCYHWMLLLNEKVCFYACNCTFLRKSDLIITIYLTVNETPGGDIDPKTSFTWCELSVNVVFHLLEWILKCNCSDYQIILQ